MLLVAALLLLAVQGAGLPGLTPPAAAQGRQGPGITVFEDADYHGRSAKFREDVPDLRRHQLNDRITSLRIPRGEVWEGCIDIDFGGRCVVFAAGERDLRRLSGWNDEISSLRRVPREGRGRSGVCPPTGGPQIALYDRAGFRGSSRVLRGPMSSLGSFGPRVRSVRVMRGRWELCEGSGWSPTCIRVTESVDDVTRFGLRGVASVRPR
jgi:Beta/Gamma crystallin